MNKRGWFVLFILGFVLVFSNIALADKKTEVSIQNVDALITEARTALTTLQNVAKPQEGASPSAMSERLKRKIDRAITKAQTRIDSAIKCKENGNLRKALSDAKHAIDAIDRVKKKIARETEKPTGGKK